MTKIKPNLTNMPCSFFLCRVTMASSCAQLCLKCRSLLCSKTVATTWQHSTQVRHCRTVTPVITKVLNGSSFFSGNHRTSPASQRWKQQMFCYSELSVKHLATEAKEDKFKEELSRADVVAYKSPLLPVNEIQMPLGTHWFALVNHTSLFTEHQHL